MKIVSTLRGVEVKPFKKNEEIVEKLSDRILGRVALQDVVNPRTGDVIVEAGQEIKDEQVALIEEAPIESVEVRSPLTCEAQYADLCFLLRK